MNSAAIAWALGQVEADKQAEQVRQQRRKEEFERLSKFFEENVDNDGNVTTKKERRSKNAKV